MRITANVSVEEESEFEVKLKQQPPRLDVKWLPYFQNHTGFVSLTRKDGVIGNALVDPTLNKPIHFVNFGAQLDEHYLVSRVKDALEYRKGLEDINFNINNPNCAYRLLNGVGDGLPFLSADVYCGFALIHIESSVWRSHIHEIGEAMMQYAGVKGVYYVDHENSKSLLESKHVCGELADPILDVVENGLKFDCSLMFGINTGLFLDQRVNRQRIACMLPQNATMLNLFSYTASFSVAAAHSVRAMTVNVDKDKACIAYAKANFRKNHIWVKKPPQHFVDKDVFMTLPVLQSKNKQYNAVLMDPPTTVRSKSNHLCGVFSVKKNYAVLARLAAPLVAPGGLLIAFANTHSLTRNKWMQHVTEGLTDADIKFNVEKELGPSPDFRASPSNNDGWGELKGVILKRA